MRWYLILIGMLLLLLPFVYSASINDTIVNSTGLNTSITFNVTRHYNGLTVGSTGIDWVGYRLTDAANESISFNITVSNGRFFVNSSQQDLPFFDSSSSTTKTINSSVTQNLTASINISATCNSGYPNEDSVENITIIYPNATVKRLPYTSFSCTNNIITFDDTLDSGQTSYTLVYEDSIGRSCSTLVEHILDLGSVISLVGALLGIMLLVMVWGIWKNRMEIQEKHINIMLGIMVTITLFSVILLVLLNRICI